MEEAAVFGRKCSLEIFFFPPLEVSVPAFSFLFFSSTAAEQCGAAFQQRCNRGFEVFLTWKKERCLPRA